jgi:hypothetical protein
MMEKQSKSVRILDLIAKCDGMRFTEIQRALWKMSNLRPFTRELRGYWCTNLCGGMHYHAGLLNFFCDKGKDGLWRRNKTPHKGHPWSVMSGALKGGTHRRREMHRRRIVAIYGEEHADAILDHHRRN